MRGIKPFKLSFISRPFSWGHSHHLGVGVLAYFPLQPEPALLTDQEMWMEVPEVLGKEMALDFGIPKSRSEFLLAGTAYQPGGEPAPTRHVRATVGDIVKSLYVVGDRYWRKGVPTEPVPFTRMPLTWERAFGGEGFERNPAGKGFFPRTELDADEDHPLPNVEAPGAMIRKRTDRPEPAGFGPIDFTSPDRQKLAGTYDRKWLDTRYPGFAEDMDWRIWNMAPSDQQQEERFRGDEPIVLEHLHPEKPRLEARLPGISARCFVVQRVGEDERAREEFHEVALELTTVWLLPDIERGVLVFHGAHPIAEDDGHDVETLMVAAERLGAKPRPQEHYREVLERRLGEDGVFEALNEHDLMPEGFTGLGEDLDRNLELTTTKQLRLKRQREKSRKRMEEARAKVASLGLDPDEHGPKLPDPDPPMASLADAPRVLEEMLEKAKQHEQELEKTRQEQKEQLAKLCEATGIRLEDMQEELGRRETGPPNFSAEGKRAQMKRLAEEARAEGHPVDELEFFATDEPTYRMWLEFEEQLRRGYLMMAHEQHPAPGAPETASEERRSAVRDAHARGESLAGWDLTGVDLDGLDLSGADLRRAFLESSDLSAVTLDGAQLEEAVLAHANLRGASLAGANLRGANLGRADLTGARLTGANLEGVVLTGVDLTHADLSDADVSEADFEEAVLEETLFAGANLYLASFRDMPLGKARFAGADLTHATFMRVDASELDFSGACLEDATFYESNARGAVFVECRMSRLRALSTSFAGAKLQRAVAEGASLRGVDLGGADLAGANLRVADLSEAKLTDANLYRIVAPRSMWIRADLRHARMISADLFEAILEKADLRSTDLRGANLYGANLALMRSDDRTTVDEAIQDRVRVLPLREPA